MATQSKIEVILSAVDKGLTSGINKARASINGMASAITGLVPTLLAAGGGAAALNKLVTVAREFDKLNAGLITATGSAENADVAFSALEDFAAKTPYDLAQVTDSFIKLVNFGLDPSERAMTSYGNTSSALGKDLNQMIEAVADAATGEFERLKEFGIKSKSEGDNVSFTFRGVTTTVKKNAEEIEQYLIKLGETNFGDAMANRMTTLDGALSNLGDEWDGVFRNISKAGIGDIIADTVRIGISALERLNEMISSGELEAYLRMQVGRWAAWASDAGKSIDLVKKFYQENFGQIKIDGNDLVTTLINAFRQFPENIRAFVGLMVVNFAAGFDKVAVYTSALKDRIKAIFTDDTFADVNSRMHDQFKQIDENRNASIEAILAEREAALKSVADQKKAAIDLQKDITALKRAGDKPTEDRTAQFGIEPEIEENGKSTSELKAEEAAANKAQAEAEKAAKAAANLAAEKLRAASQEKILALELERLDASKLPTAEARAEAELSIARRLLTEKVNLKQQELAALRSLEGVDPAAIIRAESDLSDMRLEVARSELEGQRAIASSRLAAIEDSWRQSAESIDEYRQAVEDARKLGLMETEEYNERMVASGTNLGDALSFGFEKAMKGLRTNAEVMIQIGEEIPGRLADGLASIGTAATQGFESAKEAALDFARSTINWLSQIILKQLLLNALQKSGSGASSVLGAVGSAIQGLATGGQVGGWSPTPTADNIPIWATAREFMQPVAAVDYYGLDFMERIRRLQFPKNIAHALAGGTLPKVPSSYRLAQGGQVPGQPPATTVKTGDTRLQVINVLDKNMVGDYLRTADGDTSIINSIRRNGSAIRTILGS